MRSIVDNAAKFIRLLIKRRSAYPREIQIEVTNACNLKCPICPHTHGRIPQDNIPVNLFHEIVSTNPAPKWLTLTGWGEPLLHPHFFTFIEYANQYWPRARVRFTTNGILLDRIRREHIQKLSISNISISIDRWPDIATAAPERKNSLHPPSAKVVNNIIEYSSNKKLVSKTPLILQCMVTKENQEDVKRIIEFAGRYSIRSINLARVQMYPGAAIERPSWEHEQQLIQEYSAFGKQCGVRVHSVNRPSVFQRLAAHGDTICPRTDDGLYITTDGTCTPCCNLPPLCDWRADTF